MPASPTSTKSGASPPHSARCFRHLPLRMPTVYFFSACCARAVSGQDAAAPPSNVMNSRRLIQSPRRRGRAGSATSGVLPSFILGKHTHKRPVLRRYQQDAILGYRVIVAFGLRNIIGKIRRHRLQRNVRRQLYADIRIERSTSRLVPERLVDRPPFFVAKGLERVGERDQLVVGGILLREFRRDGVGVCRRPRHRERAVDERSLRRLRIRSWRLLSDRQVKTPSKRQYRKNHSHGVPPLPCRQSSRAMV